MARVMAPLTDNEWSKIENVIPMLPSALTEAPETKENGEYEEDLCSKCDGYGTIIKDNLAYPCSCRVERLNKQRHKQASDTIAKMIGLRYANDRFNSKHIDNRESIREARSFLESLKFYNNKIYGNILVLSGGTCTGKTTAISCLLHEIIFRKPGIDVYYSMWQEHLNRVYYADFDTKNNLINKSWKAGITILDDFGDHNEKHEELSRQTLYDIIKLRFKENIPLVITTMWDIDYLDKWIGNDEHIRRRLLE